MPSPKLNDLAVLADFLERESRRYELFRNVRESIARIGSLVNAEKEARLALEATQADLAWARAELDIAHGTIATAKNEAHLQLEVMRQQAEAAMALARERHADENHRLEAETEEKRAALKKIIARLEALRAATGAIVEALARKSANTGQDMP